VDNTSSHLMSAKRRLDKIVDSNGKYTIYDNLKNMNIFVYNIFLFIIKVIKYIYFFLFVLLLLIYFDFILFYVYL